MSDCAVPTGWRAATFGDVLKERTELSPPGAQLLSVTNDRGVIPQSQSSKRDTSSRDKSKYKFVRINDIVYNTIRMWQGLSGVSCYEGIVSPAYTVCIASRDVDPRYIGAVLKHDSYIAMFRRFSQGLVDDTRSLKYECFAQLPVILPPLADQHRIADILDTADTAIQQTEALIAKLKQMKAGLLQDLLTRGLGEQGQLRDPVAHPEQFKDSPFGCIPSQWITPTFDEVVVDRAPICYGILQPGPYVDNGVPMLAAHNLSGNYKTNVHRVANEIERQYERSRVMPNDVLLSVKGTVGRVGIVPLSFAGNISRDVARIRLKPLSLPQYVRQVLLSPAMQNYLETAVVGTTRAEMSIGILKKLRLPVPSTEEQQRIADVLDTHDARIDAEEAYRDKLKLLKKGLMDDLLTGRVRVNALQEVAV